MDIVRENVRTILLRHLSGKARDRTLTWEKEQEIVSDLEKYVKSMTEEKRNEM